MQEVGAHKRDSGYFRDSRNEAEVWVRNTTEKKALTGKEASHKLPTGYLHLSTKTSSQVQIVPNSIHHFFPATAHPPFSFINWKSHLPSAIGACLWPAPANSIS